MRQPPPQPENKRRRLSDSTIVAVVADTHGVLDVALLEQIRELSPDHLLHLGDIGDVRRKSRLTGIDLLAALRAELDGETPVTAVSGNVDEPDRALQATGLQDCVLVEIAGWRLLLTHGHLSGLAISAKGFMDPGIHRRAVEERADMVLFGHSHVPLVASQDRHDAAQPPAIPSIITAEKSNTVWEFQRNESQILSVNPGSAGPRRFKLPRCWFQLKISSDCIEIERRDIG